MKRWQIAVGVVVLVAGVGFAGWFYDKKLAIHVPTYAAPTRTTWLQQNWAPGPRTWFHHANQGTLTFGMPIEWFLALDRPQIFGSGRLADAAYLDRFGFIPDPDHAGPSGLPIGFAGGDDTTQPDGSPWTNPQTGAAFKNVGLTCAACHTGRFTYKGQEVLVDGGPALTNLGTFRQAVGVSLLFTRYLPGRLDTFATRVLGPDASAPARDALKAQFKAFFARGKQEIDWVDATRDQTIDEGFGRLDALNRIGNQVFGVDMNVQANYAPITAPVHFPRIWDSSWFTWVQYNGSIEQPMVRNAGEALGVAARLQVSGPTPFASSVQVRTLDAMERQLAGGQPNVATGFTGLQAPHWSDAPFKPVDPGLAADGAKLYQDRCQKCHLAPTSSPEFWASQRWITLKPGGERFLDVQLVPVEHVGTDPSQAAGMAARKVQIPAALGLNHDDFGGALGALVEKVVNHWYDTQQPSTSPEDRERMNGSRPNGIQAKLAYKVRPLDGIWATPPYLHNGSVPTLYDLLSPGGERPKTFYLGNREYDPVHVGYVTTPLTGGFKFDTKIAGNSNRGHEFSDTPGPGVIGKGLTPAQRMQLIEYLKTL